MLELLTILGLGALAGGMWQAVKTRADLRQLLLWLCCADVGYFLIGVGLGTGDGQAGAVLQVLFTGTARLLAFVTLFQLARLGGETSLTALTGTGRAKPLAGVLFAFGMFAALGVSPFFTPDAKPLILHAALQAKFWLVPILVVAANVISVVLTITAAHAVWLSSGRYENRQESAADNVIPLILAGLLAVMGVFGHGMISLAASFVGADIARLPSFTLGGHAASLIPCLGAIVVWCLGHFSVTGRNILACACLGLALLCALADTSLAPLSRFFAIITTGIGLVVVVYSIGYIKGGQVISESSYYFFLLMLFGSLAGIATATNLGGFYVFWEVMTLTSYVLVAYEGTAKAHAAAIKYFIMCGVAAAVMLPGLLLLSTHLGSLDIAVLAVKSSSLGAGLATGIALLALVGFGVKAGLVPGHSWLPDAHPAAPSSISAPLSGVLTKAGLFGMAQLFLGVFGVGLFLQPGGEAEGIPFIGVLVCLLGLVTMLYGEIMALQQTDIKRLFAYSTMGQIGEITMTFGLLTWLAVTGALFHVANHAVMKNLLFLCSGVLIMRAGTRELSGLKGFGKAMPFTATCMVIGLISILGLPPFAGFMSKFVMLSALGAKSVMLAGMLLLASMAGCVYYMRILRVLIFEPYTGPAVEEAPLAIRIALGSLALLCVLMGMFPGLGLSLVLPVADSLALGGKVVLAALPRLSVEWSPYTLILALGAAVPYYMRHNPVQAGKATAGILAAATLLVLLFGWKLDTLSFLFALAIPAIGAVNMYYASEYMMHSHTQWRFYVFFLFMTAGLTGVAASADLFSFFFFWEIMSSWSLYFVIVHEENTAALREGFKYFFFNVLGAAFIFLGVVLMVSWAGSASFEAVRLTLLELSNGKIALVMLLMATGLVMKAAQLPFRIDIQMHPATAPTPVSGYISSVLLKSAIFGLVKLFLALGSIELLSNTAFLSEGTIMSVVVWVGGITIVMAALFAVVQTDLKLVFIYSTVSQLGYMVVAVALGSSLGIAGGLLHLFNHMLFKDLLFLVAGAVLIQTNRHSVDAMGGLGNKMPWTMLFFAIGALCVIGVPPSNGFTSKWIIYHALMEKGYVLVAILSLVGSVITLAYLAKVMHSVFLGQVAPGLETVKEAPKSMLLSMGILAGGCVLTSVFPGLLLGPLNVVLDGLSLAPLDVAPWGLASGAGAWNATATAILVGVAWYGGRYVLHAFTKNQRVNPIHTCGIEPDALNLHTTTQDMYTAPVSFLAWFRRRG